MAINRLTATQIRKLPVGTHSDGGGLQLKVTDSGSRQWQQRATVGGKRILMGIGSVGSGISLADAGERSQEIRAIAAKGEDPRVVWKGKQQAKADTSTAATFDRIAREYISKQEATWSNEKHIHQWKMTMLGPDRWIEGRSIDYCSSIRHRPINEVKTQDIVAILEPYWLTKADTASKIRQRLEAIFGYATAYGIYDGQNPAVLRNHLDKILPSQSSVVRGHFRTIPYAELPDAFSKIQAKKGIGALALQFAIFTASREYSVRMAKWEEIDLDEKLWTIPAENMKGKSGRRKAFRLPLSTGATSLLQKLKRVCTSDLIFPGKNNRPISDQTMDKVLDSLEIDATPHGIARSSFKDWAVECTDFPDEVSEQALAHEDKNKVRAAYRRGDGIEKRRELMQLWCDYCLSTGA